MSDFTDVQALAALKSQVSDNPAGCSAIDVLIGLGYYHQAEDALGRLLAGGLIRQTSPGNYLPTSP